MPFLLHIGRLYLPLSGVCAAAGLMAALMLSRVTAPLAGLDREKVWDAALVVVLAGFLFSRLLLVVANWRSFVAAPLLVLALPAINDTGVVLTALFGWGYLRWKRLPALGFLDAMAPSAALVWASLSLGWYLEGTREGMPTHFFLRSRGGLNPVELYATAAGLGICGLLLLGRRRPRGWVFAAGLALAGAAVFSLDFLRLPGALDGAAMLDPVQWLGLGMIVVAGAVWIGSPARKVRDAV